MIRVLVVPVGREPYVKEIDGGLSSMQALVKGFIEAVPLEPYVDLVCHEEGKLVGLPLNRHVAMLRDTVRGDFFISRSNENGDSVDLTEADVITYSHMFSLSPRYAHA